MLSLPRTTFLVLTIFFSLWFRSAHGQSTLDTLVLDQDAKTNLPVPPRPSDFVLDSARFLGEETRRNLIESLSKEAKDHGVSVYLLTVPSLPKNGIGPFTKRVAEEWTKDLFGAVVVFDDGTGLVSIERSELVSKRFYEFEFAAILRESMRLGKRPRLSRDGLFHTMKSVSAALSELKLRANKEDRDSLYTKIAAGSLALLAVLTIGVLQHFRYRSEKDPVAASKV